MYCDTRGAQYLEGRGLRELWDELRITIPDDLGGINPHMFWAAGKLFALEQASCPVLMLDTDFIAWELPELNDGIVAAHREEMNERTYPPVSSFDMRDYTFDDSLDYSPRPLNTAFLYISDEQFKQYYVHNAMSFMRAAEDNDDYLAYMVYAEQRLLAILAKHAGIKVKTLFEFKERYNQSRYTHTWGAKDTMRKNVGEYERFCDKCKARIKSDFPEWVHIIAKIERNV
jgi:hypothetical protein